MKIEHLEPSAGAERVVEALARDGCAVVDGLAPDGVLDEVQREMAPYVDAARPGTDDFTGHRTKRIGGLVARSPASRWPRPSWGSIASTSCLAPSARAHDPHRRDRWKSLNPFASKSSR